MQSLMDELEQDEDFETYQARIQAKDDGEHSDPTKDNTGSDDLGRESEDRDVSGLTHSRRPNSVGLQVIMPDRVTARDYSKSN